MHLRSLQLGQSAKRPPKTIPRLRLQLGDTVVKWATDNSGSAPLGTTSRELAHCRRAADDAGIQGIVTGDAGGTVQLEYGK